MQWETLMEKKKDFTMWEKAAVNEYSNNLKYY